MKNDKKRPLTGVGVMVKKDGKILLGKRINSHGSMTWSFPGGHLEFKESLFECAKREVFEETGISIKNLSLGPFTNDIFEKENLHYLTVYIIADHENGTPAVKEPDKCLQWKWFNPENLPKNLFLPLKNLAEQHDIKKLAEDTQ
ncbi:MAG: NUDIX hydrolase [Desulfobacteraceae bacterium]|jgi:8-oxo-dGTP diphosphatase